MEDKIKPDYSVPLNSTEGSKWMIDPRYDFIRTFPWLDFAAINIVTEEGIQRLYVDMEQAQAVAETSMIGVCEMEFITESEYEVYLELQADGLEDWLA